MVLLMMMILVVGSSRSSIPSPPCCPSSLALEVLENLETLGFTLIFRGPLLGDLAMPLERLDPLEVLENLETLGFTLIFRGPLTWRFSHAP